MRRHLWAAIVASSLLYAFPAEAQQAGVIVGVDASAITGHVYANPDAGGVFGGFVQYSLTDNFYFEPEIFFSMEGGYCSNYLPPTLTFTGLYYKSTASLKLNYVSLPLLLRLRTFKSSLLHHGFDFFAGPELEFLATTISRFTWYPPTGAQTFTDKSTDGFRRFGLGVEIGGGPNVELGSTTVGSELKYSLGLTSAFKAADHDWFNSVWSIMAHVDI